MIDPEIVAAVAALILADGGPGFAYVFTGGARLWGPRRGEPFCGHPFELTWKIEPRLTWWRCPKCGTPFEVREHADGVRRWTMVR